jgi:deoxyribose-phosphate aldolase
VGAITVESLTYRDIAKSIDHSLLRPELELDVVAAGVRLAVRYDVASATVRPADVALAVDLVEGSQVLVGATATESILEDFKARKAASVAPLYSAT